MHCYATFYGPVTPPNTGFVAFQNVVARGATFRIAATGTVLEMDSSFKVRASAAPPSPLPFLPLLGRVSSPLAELRPCSGVGTRSCA
jgi:hypothetical protein